jgi:hypothetical protein
MKGGAIAAAAVTLSLLSHVGLSAADEDATLLRLFLRDGVSLVSYGEFTRIANKVIVSLPTSPLPNPSLQLVSIPADRVDWERTNRYTNAARTARYVATQAEADYIAINNSVARALNRIAVTPDPAERLAIAEAARKTLAEWPESHFNHRLTEVHQMLSMLDESIADLRAAAGADRFELSLVASAAPPPPSERLLPAPDAVQSIQQMITAAELTDSPAERQSLFTVALANLDRDAASLPGEWAASTRIKAKAALDAETKLDRAYQTVVRAAMLRAESRARFADVRGIQRVLDGLHESDETLGRRRPDVVTAAVSAVEERLDAARRLQLARDRWLFRAPVLREYFQAMTQALGIFGSLQPALDDIKTLAGSTPAALNLMQRRASRAITLLAQIVPPEECRSAHSLLESAAHLADNAARIRRAAAETGDITRAWDASSAAAGALMLSAKAKVDIQTAVNRPQLP